MVVVEPMVLQMLVAMTLVLAVVMPRRHGSQVLSLRRRRPARDAMDHHTSWIGSKIYCRLNAAAHR